MKSYILGGVVGILLLVGILSAHSLYMKIEIRGCKKTYLDLIEAQQPITEEDMKKLLPAIERQCQTIIRSSY